MRRLGMWNRLALVLSIIATVAVPAAMWYDYMDTAYKNREIYYEHCRRANAGTANGNLKAWLERDEDCTKRLSEPVISPSSSFYWGATWSTALGCAIFYLIIWGIVATAKWVWRGRSVGQSKS